MSKSDTDLSITTSLDQGFVNTSSHKRFRTGTPPSPDRKGVFELFKNDIRAMLESWKTEQANSSIKIITEQKAIMSKLMTDIAELKVQNSEIQKSNLEIEKSMSFISQQYEDLKKEVVSLQKERRNQKLYIESLERKVQDLQLKSRSSILEIRNVPQQEREIPTDLSQLICNIGQNVGLSMHPPEVRDVYRLPGKSGSSRPIIAEFTTVQTKQDFLSAVHQYNKNKKNKEEKLNTEVAGIRGHRQPIYVAE